MRFSPEIFGSAIVAVGSFNPAIFSPDWLLAQRLIGADDCDASKASPNFLVTSQVSSFETDWFHLQVVDNQFSLTSKGPLTPALRDLAQGVFETVPHTPVTAVGLNFLGHFKLDTEPEYQLVGDTLAPKNVWRRIFPEEKYFVGLTDLQMVVTRGKYADQPSDRATVQIQPSTKVKSGVYLAMYDHRANFSQEPSNAKASVAARVVRDDWEQALAEAERVFDEILATSKASS